MRLASLSKPAEAMPTNARPDAAQRVGDGADHAVPAEHGDGLARARGVARERLRVVDVARVRAAHFEPVPAQRLLDVARDAQRPPAAGGRIHEQRYGSGHERRRATSGRALLRCGRVVGGRARPRWQPRRSRRRGRRARPGAG